MHDLYGKLLSLGGCDILAEEIEHGLIHTDYAYGEKWLYQKLPVLILMSLR